ncbi:MAG TPA: hypothetical protein VK814_14745 [Acidobacteriaceae bacterium]|nr:hypothetical protein [Acidobacteriaceae bacterium]
MRHTLTVAILLLTPTLAHAQQSPWRGEWGAFTDTSPRQGQRLTISDCTATTCTFSVSAWVPGGNCGTASKATFTITSPTEATANLPGESASQTCKLQLHRDPAGITVTAAGDTCTSYYCTSPTVTFAHTYKQRSSTPYVGLHADACLSNASPATIATCTDTALAKLEQQWQDLYADFPLAPDPNKNENGYSHAVAVDATILQHCDTAPNPATCLHDRFTADIALLNANQQAFIAGYTDRGDPATASTLGQKIAGRYRHSFANGDVQGDHYRSTDTLTLTLVGAASIRFDAHLNFYNGHECSLSGGALFRKNGSFVYDDKPPNPDPSEPVCHLGIKPTSTGVTFQDYTGACKNYCGARGGWNGAAFTFAQRVPASK